MSGFEREREYIDNLKVQEEVLKRANPWISSPVASEIAERRARLSWYISARDEILTLCRQKSEDGFDKAQALWNRRFSEYGDFEEALMLFRDELCGRGLVDQRAAMAVNLRFVDPERQRRLQEAAAEAQKLRDAKNLILKAIPPAREIEALGAYNRQTDRPLSWEKLNDWVEALCVMGILGLEWRPGAKGGSVLYKMLESMRNLPNKMLQHPARENK